MIKLLPFEIKFSCLSNLILKLHIKCDTMEYIMNNFVGVMF